MTDILKSPVRVDLRGERLYFNVPGEVCVDLCSGLPEDGARVLALLGQVQAGFSLLTEVREAIFKPSSIDSARDMHERITAILRDAGVLNV